MDLRRLLITLKQHIWLLIALTLGSLTVFLVLPRLGTTVVYVSTAKILLTPSQRVGVSSAQSGGYDPGNWLADQQTLEELVTSERLLSRVVQVCSLRGEWHSLRDRIHMEPLATDYGRRVSMFALSAEDESPKQAKKITEAAVAEFTSYVEELSAREYANTRRFLEELVAEAQEKVDDTEEKLLTITTSHADAKQSESSLENLYALDAERRKVKEDVSVLEAEVSSVQSFVSGQSSVMPSSMLQKPDASLAQMETAVATARLKLVELEQLYTNDNLQVVDQRTKLAKMQQLYDSRRADYASSIGQEKNLALSQKRKQLQSLDAKLQELRNQQLSPTEKRQVAKLERQLAMWEDNHLNLVKQLYQARVMEQSSRRQGAISVLESPSEGTMAKAKKSRTLSAQMALGLPFSLAFAIGSILALDLVGASLRLMPKIESSLGVPVIAVIPPVDKELGELWEAYKREHTLPLGLMSLMEEENEPAAPPDDNSGEFSDQARGMC